MNQSKNTGALLRARIDARMTALTINASEASRRVGRGRTLINDIMSGKSSSPHRGTMIALARGLETSLEYLNGDVEDPNPRGESAATQPVVASKARSFIEIPLLREVEFMAFRPRLDLRAAPTTFVSAPLRLRHESVLHFAVRAGDDSMALATEAGTARPIMRGAIACLTVSHDSQSIPIHGRIYLVESRNKSDRSLFEYTLRKCEFAGDSVWLKTVPANGDPDAIQLARARDSNTQAIESNYKILGELYCIIYPISNL